MEPAVRWRWVVTAVILAVLVYVLYWFLANTDYTAWGDFGIFLLVFVGLGPLVLLPLWRGHSRLADWRAVGKDEFGDEVLIDAGDVADDILAAYHGKRRRR